jgi:ABC-type nickel/cobalt efflux system permease component RcnA
MFGLDERIAEQGSGGGLAIAFLVALLLGLRHATDPDHLTAVSSLVLGERRGGRRGATMLGVAWGLGHALALIALGLPFVLWGDALPARVQQAAEIAIGALIVGLGVRLLVRWRRGYFHVHPHHHGEVVHVHPHVHEHAPETTHEHPRAHGHAHEEALGRTPAAAFGIGLVHGVGGSAGAGILLVSSIEDRTAAAIALFVFAGATALSMGVATWAFGHVITRRRVAARLESAVPVLGVLGMLFGVWYALGSLEAVPYVF